MKSYFFSDVEFTTQAKEKVPQNRLVMKINEKKITPTPVDATLVVKGAVSYLRGQGLKIICKIIT